VQTPSSYFDMQISTQDEHACHATLKDLVRSAMRRNQAADCLLAPALKTLSFQGLFDHICDIETQLRAAGIGPGDCVASALPCGVDAVSAFMTFVAVYARQPDDDGSALDCRAPTGAVASLRRPQRPRSRSKSRDQSD
jgi:hypothetical protein